MSIEHREPPKRFGRALRRSLSEVVSTRAGSEFLGWHYESAPAATKPHPVYSVGRDDVSEGKLLGAARLSSWRSLIRQEEGAVHAVELSSPEGDEEPRLLAVSKGPFGRATLSAVGTAERFESTRAESLELRLLRVPALHFVAVWLHGRRDALLPLEDHPAGLRAQQPYSEQDVLAVLQPEAQAQREAQQDEGT